MQWRKMESTFSTWSFNAKKANKNAAAAVQTETNSKTEKFDQYQNH